MRDRRSIVGATRQRWYFRWYGECSGCLFRHEEPCQSRQRIVGHWCPERWSGHGPGPLRASAYIYGIVAPSARHMRDNLQLTERSSHALCCASCRDHYRRRPATAEASGEQGRPASGRWVSQPRCYRDQTARPSFTLDICCDFTAVAEYRRTTFPVVSNRVWRS